MYYVYIVKTKNTTWIIENYLVNFTFRSICLENWVMQKKTIFD